MSTTDRTAPTGEAAVLQFPTKRARAESIASGRKAAAQAIVAGYENAIAALLPTDKREVEWHRRRLADARLYADFVTSGKTGTSQ